MQLLVAILAGQRLKMANEYDKILRENFRKPKELLLKKLLHAEAIRVTPLVPKTQHTILEREADTVAEIATENERSFIIHIEWQSSNDPKIAMRMAIYDLLLYQSYQKEVVGVVLYVGKEKLTMNNELSFAQFSYGCDIVDIRSFEPEFFLASEDPGEVIMAILAGNSSDRIKTIKRIFTKLRLLLDGDKIELKKRVKQLELLSMLRGEEVQNLIIEEENNMPVTIDITQDLRFRAGVEKGKLDTVKKMLRAGLAPETVQQISDLPIEEIRKLIKKTSA